MKYFLICLLSLVLIHCNGDEEGKEGEEGEAAKTAESGDKKDPEKAAAPAPAPTFASPELNQAQSITGVYTGAADIDYSWSLSPSKWSETSDIKISINHSGDENDKKLIVAVSYEKELLCTLISDLLFTEQQGSLWLNTFNNKVKAQHTGKVMDANTVSLIKITKDNKESPLSLYLHQSQELVENLTKTDEAARSFDELYKKCFGEKKEEAKEEEKK